MNNRLTFAEIELDILVKSLPDPDNRPVIEPFIPEILALVKKFGESGQSGGSAPFVARAISDSLKKLMLHQPIMPLTGIDDEWVDVREHAGNNPVDPMKWQNKRLSSVFKEAEGDAYYLDAMIWKNQNGSTWSGAAILKDDIILLSRAYIKSFPFTPKTFIVDVIETEIAKDDWEFTVKDAGQLDEVFEYYNPYYKL